MKRILLSLIVFSCLAVTAQKKFDFKSSYNDFTEKLSVVKDDATAEVAGKAFVVITDALYPNGFDQNDFAKRLSEIGIGDPYCIAGCYGAYYACAGHCGGFGCYGCQVAFDKCVAKCQGPNPPIAVQKK